MTTQQSRPESRTAQTAVGAAHNDTGPVPLEVDGARPAVAWVASLPAAWTNPRERLVLLVLACDAFADVSAPGGAALASWCGLINGRLYEALGSLMKQTATRPALLERVGRDGQPIPEGKRYGGRARTGYRLRTEIHPVELSRAGGRVGGRELSPVAGRVGPPPPVGELSREGGRDEAPNSPEKLSRETLPAGRETPYPSQEHHDDVGQLDICATAARYGKAWDPAGVNAAIRRATASGRSHEEAVRAGLLAAADPAASTPAALCWGKYYVAREHSAPDAGPICEVCAKPEPSCRAAAAKSGDPHEFTPAERTR